MQHAEIRRMAAKIIGASLADAEDLCDLHDRVGFLLHFLVLYHVVIHICPSCGSTHAPHKPLYASLLQISDYWQVYYSNIRYKCKDAEFLVQIKFNNFCKRGIIHLPPGLLNNLDMAVASQHIWCMPQGGDADANTQAMVRAMDTCPKICILGHPDDGRYPLDYPALVRSAGERDVLLEVNNTSLSPACSRVNSTANVKEMLSVCRREGVPVVVGSDAHFVSAVGGHQYAQALLEEVGFPAELVLNGDPAAFLAHLERRLGRGS